MESANAFDLNLLLNVLVLCEEQLKMLEASLNGASTQAEHCRQVQATIRKAISMAQYFNSIELARLSTCHNNLTASDSPVSNTGSPRSEVSEKAFKEQERREMCKKRKTMPKLTERVYLSSTEANDELEDGYSWRKYGQKDILGAKHPRGYYRCTHKHTAGCLAVKQVQKCDDNPLALDITYRGEHTCVPQKSNPAATPATNEQNIQEIHQVNEQQQQNQSQQLLLSFQKNLKVKTEGLDKKEIVNSFSFPSTQINSLTTPENNLFSTSSTPENNFVSSFSSQFISPVATSESNYFSLSGCGNNNLVGTAAVNACESDFTEIISAASTSNSPFGDMGNFFDVSEFDSSYSTYDGTYCFGSLA